jgi:hypothetical protein
VSFLKNNFLIILLLFSVSQIFAQGETAVPFLTLEPSARANGMAGSFTAVSNDAFSMYYNPAGISNLEYGSFGYYRYQWYTDQPEPSYLYTAGTFTVPEIGSFGISYTELYLGENVRVDESGNFLGKFESKEWALSLGYARSLSSFTTIGASLKIIVSQLSNVNLGEPENGKNTGFALDLGFLYKNIFPDLCFKHNYLNIPYEKYMKHRTFSGPLIGISLINVGPNMEYLGNEDPLPQQLRLGLGWNIIDTDILGFLVTSDLRKYLIKRDEESADQFYEAWVTSWKDFSFNEIQFSYGAEFTFFYLFSIRFGHYFPGKRGSREDYWTYGFSFGPEKLHFSWYKVKKENREDTTWHIGFSIAY